MELMNRDEAFLLLQKYVKHENMIVHSLASEVVMRELAKYLNEDVEKWGLAGLLHDIDVEITNADLVIHGLEAVKILSQKKVSLEVIEAIKLHNEKASGEIRSTVFQHALAAGETITGLIIATAKVYPDKKIKSVKVKSVVKRMKEKAFAASVDRDIILECEKIGISLDEFASLALLAMSSIDDKLGL